MPDKPYAPSCDKNREPILAVLRERLAERTALLEIGSGTGQHAVYFAPALPRLSWQTSDRAENLPGIRAWLAEAGLPNTPAPIELDVTGPWPARRFDAVFTANTLHIMPWSAVESLFAALPGVMVEQALFVAYGPFNYGGKFTSESNARFDASLKASAPHQGIRDFDDLDALARRAGMALAEDVAMPSNNRCLVWRRAG
jgi:cyclopropane fatty-acyl-phospholipid synthase-like methyltransferase